MDKIKVALTHGDTNGIGYEIILKMLEDPRMAELCTFVIYGSGKAAGYYRKAMDLPSIRLQRINKASEAQEGVYNIINVISEEVQIEPGKPTKVAGAAALAALEAAVRDLRAGDVDVLVTAPIDKHSIQCPEFSFPGHTEYLQACLTDDSNSEDDKALMMMCAGDLRIALATTHLPLREVADAITEELLMDKIAQFERSLRIDFGIVKPRIAVLSLNPHCGENGLLGVEEAEVIAPTIAAAQEAHMLVFGPYAADGFFGSGNHTLFDGVLAMYHDQGLTPFKTIAMNSGVNFTAGLPYVRTSPDHGTGFDIAGQGKANPESLREAVYMAIDIYRRRNAK